MVATVGNGPVLLVIDYPGRRDEARIADLRLESAGWDVRYLLTPPLGRELTSREYAQGIMRRHALLGSLSNTQVGAALAFCAAAPIAQEIVAELAGSRAEPVPMLLFDGEPSPPENIARDFRVAAAQLAATPAAATDAVIEARTFTSGWLTTRPADCVEQWRQCLVDLGTRALREDGADEDEAAAAVAVVADRYLDWLVYLVAAHNTSWPAWNGDVIHIASREHGYIGDWPGSASTVLSRVEADRNQLLRRPDTRERALCFLASLTKGATRVAR